MRQLLILFVCFFTLKTHSFVNIESLRQSQRDGWYGSTGLSSGGSYGNINIFRGGINSQNIYKTYENEIIFSNRLDYVETPSNRITNSGSTHLRYARRWSANIKWELFSQAEYNQFQNLALRTLNGGGLRWKLFYGDDRAFYLGTGLFYEDEVVLDDEDQNNFRGNMYFSFRRLFEERLELTITAYYQPSHKSFLDYRVRINLGLELKVTEEITWTNELRYFADTRPPQGIEKEDFIFNVGMNVRY